MHTTPSNQLPLDNLFANLLFLCVKCSSLLNCYDTSALLLLVTMMVDFGWFLNGSLPANRRSVRAFDTVINKNVLFPRQKQLRFYRMTIQCWNNKISPHHRCQYWVILGNGKQHSNMLQQYRPAEGIDLSIYLSAAGSHSTAPIDRVTQGKKLRRGAKTCLLAMFTIVRLLSLVTWLATFYCFSLCHTHICTPLPNVKSIPAARMVCARADEISALR